VNKVIFHLGAHKTATTYLQNRLRHGSELLSANKVFYPGIGEMRKQFTYAFNQQHNTELMDKMLQLRSTHTLLLSDENMAGGVDDVLRLGRQYLELASKLVRYCAMVNTDEPVIFLALREYSSFIVSIYCEYLRHHPYIDFDTFAHQYAVSNFSWPTVIAEIRAAMPKAEIHIWDFQNFRAVEEQVITAMTGLAEGSLPELKGTQRDSFSELAVRCIRALSDVIDVNNVRKIMPALANAFPRGPDYPAYNPFSAEFVAEAKARYQADLAQIASRFPDVRIIEPKPEPAA
jgi:hypothetical protein